MRDVGTYIKIEKKLVRSTEKNRKKNRQNLLHKIKNKVVNSDRRTDRHAKIERTKEVDWGEMESEKVRRGEGS